MSSDICPRLFPLVFRLLLSAKELQNITLTYKYPFKIAPSCTELVSKLSNIPCFTARMLFQNVESPF